MVLGGSRNTSDFWFDCLLVWWESVKGESGKVKRLVVRLDNGLSRHRQWYRRLIEFVDRTGLEVECVYYPPYHSKYNPIERVWGVLEEHWNGTLLKTMEEVKQWARSMTWKGVHPEVYEIEKEYAKGVTLDDADWERVQTRLERSQTLPKWHVVVRPRAA